VSALTTHESRRIETGSCCSAPPRRT